MAFGHIYVRVVTFLAIGSTLGLVALLYPSAIQDFANALIFWETNQQYRVYELFAIILSLGLLMTAISIRSISNSAKAQL